jgi:hypothetical protein
MRGLPEKQLVDNFCESDQQMNLDFREPNLALVAESTTTGQYG